MNNPALRLLNTSESNLPMSAANPLLSLSTYAAQKPLSSLPQPSGNVLPLQMQPQPNTFLPYPFPILTCTGWWIQPWGSRIPKYHNYLRAQPISNNYLMNINSQLSGNPSSTSNWQELVSQEFAKINRASQEAFIAFCEAHLRKNQPQNSLQQGIRFIRVRYNGVTVYI